MKGKFWRALYLLGLVPFLFSCASYTARMQQYNLQLNQRNFAGGIKSIEKNKILSKQRNKLLQEMELGRLNQLSGNISASNLHLNAADQIMESNFRNIKDVALGNLVNPMLEIYKGEDFEKLMVNYFKGLNYCKLGLKEDAVVEARRITLANNRLNEKYTVNKEKHYYSDPFILNLQGMLYEHAGEWNNAFISYRNAVDIYTKAGGSYFGVEMPEQLKQDLLYSAHRMGFTDLENEYAKLLKTSRKERSDSTGSLIVFIEQGRAPIKDQIVYNIINTGISRPMYYTDAFGNQVNFNFNHREYGVSDQKITNIRTIRVALPFYRPVTLNKASCTIRANQIDYISAPVQDFNTLAVSVLQDRFLSELMKAVARYLIKSSISKGLEKGTESIGKKNASKESDPEKKKKKEENAKDIANAIGFLLNSAAAASEQADTRCWLSLPAFISYVRIPLQKGENIIEVNAGGQKQNIKITGKPGLQITSVSLP